MSHPLKTFLIFVILPLGFFLTYNFLNFSTPRVFNSPDETVNYAFSREFAQNGQLFLTHKADYGEWGKYIFPRSTFSTGDKIVPTGFWGINLIFGVLGAIFGTFALVFITPILTIIGAFCFYKIIRHIFGQSVGELSFFLFLVQPVVWYYTSRSLFPNMPFVSLLIVGVFFLVLSPITKSKLSLPDGLKQSADDLLGIGGVLGALIIRPSEVFWITGGFLILLLFYRRQFVWHRLALWFGVSTAVALIYLKINDLLYGGGLTSYTASESFVLHRWYNFIFPFGVSWWQTARAGFYYFVILFWWLSIPTAVVLLKLMFKSSRAWWTKERVVFGTVFVLVSVFLFIFYGSFVDSRFDLRTIGISYTRYWLPIFIMALPFLAEGILAVSQFFKNKVVAKAVFALILMAILGLSLKTVFVGPDGLIAVRQNILQGVEEVKQIRAQVPADALIVTDTEDKFVWPEYDVLIHLKNGHISQAVVESLKEDRTVYFYSVVLSKNAENDLKNQLGALGLKINLVDDFGEHVLYQLSLTSEI